MLAIEAAAVTLKVAVVAPAGTVTDAGRVNKVLSLANVTPNPPVGAVWVTVTVHVPTALIFRIAAPQVRDEIAGTVTIAFVTPETVCPSPVASTPTGLVIVMAVVPAVGVSVSITVAATPEAIGFAFVGPVSTQVTGPVEAQYAVLPAAVATGPATTEMAEIWPEG